MSEQILRFLDERNASEERVLTFDFSDDLVEDETLDGTPTAEVMEVKRGSPADKDDLLVPGIALDLLKKLVLVPTGAVGAAGEYTIKVVCATTTVGKVLALKAVLVVNK